MDAGKHVLVEGYEHYKDSVGVVFAKKDSTANEPEHVKAPWRPWGHPDHDDQSGASPVHGGPAAASPRTCAEASYAWTCAKGSFA